LKAIARFLQVLEFDFREFTKSKQSIAVEKASSKMRALHMHYNGFVLVYRPYMYRDKDETLNNRQQELEISTLSIYTLF